MPIKYKINVLEALKEKGYNTGKIRKDKIMGEAMLQKIREGEMVSWAVFETSFSVYQNECFPIRHRGRHTLGKNFFLYP